MKNLSQVGALLLLVGLISPWASADSSPPIEPVWSGNAEASILASAGNSDSQTYGLGGEVAHHPLPWNYKFKTAYLRTSSQGLLNAERFIMELRAGRNLFPDLEVFVQASLLINRFAGFNSRSGLDAGLAYSVISTDPHLLKIQLAGGYINENRIDGVVNQFAAASGGLNYRWKISASAELTEEFTLIDSLKNSSDWRLANTVSISAKMTDILSLKVSQNTMFLNVPVTGKKNTDTVEAVALVAKF